MSAKYLLLSLLGLFTATNPLVAALLNYDFGTAGAPTANATFLAPNLSASVFSARSGGGFNTTDGSPASSYQASKNWNQNVGQIGSANYFTFTVTANSGYQLDLSALSFALKSSGGPTTFEVRSSLDNYGSAIGSGAVSGSWNTPGAIDLSGAAYQNLSTITFRIYGFGAGNNGNGSLLLIDNVELDGLVAVPEPATVALAIFGLGFAMLSAGRSLRRKRRL